MLLNRRNDRHGVDLHKGVSTHSEAKYTASLRDMAKNLHLGVAKPRWGNHPTFGFAPKAEDFLPIPNHKLIRHYSLGIDSDICIPRIGGAEQASNSIHQERPSILSFVAAYHGKSMEFKAHSVPRLLFLPRHKAARRQDGRRFALARHCLNPCRCRAACGPEGRVAAG
ncbi:hypothetical protein DO76_919 [Brucella suis]|nr:hypothetical protein DO76_919 [Brucella suis]